MTESSDSSKPKSADYKREASWPSVLFFIHLNILGLYGIVILFTNTKLITIVFCKYHYIPSEVNSALMGMIAW